MMERNSKNGSKISGYLLKKGKMKMIGSYKKYWFVLEGGLLLYYRSKDDYESISPCKGSINLGPPCLLKPCPSLVGVFQIQTRIATVTLRAENLEDQNRWMQAIMSEIQPNKNVHRMSHFRYSMDNNVPQLKEQISDSTPDAEPSPNSQDDIIHRLQKLGAQSYSYPIDTLSKTRTSSKERVVLPNLYSNVNEYEYNRMEHGNSESFEHVYERISSEYLDIINKENSSGSEATKNGTKMISRGSETLRIKSQENRPPTIIIENDTYAISIQQKETADCADAHIESKNEICRHKDKPKNMSKSAETTEEKNKKNKKIKQSKSFIRNKKKSKEETFIIENDIYAAVDKNKTLSKEPEYSLKDLNENKVAKNDIVKSDEENAYSIPYSNSSKQIEDVYEDIDRGNVEYAEPCLQPVDDSDKITSKLKKKKNHEQPKESVEELKHSGKIKKTRSFMSRVWRKKEKSKDKSEEKIFDEKEEDDNIYETVPASVVEKVCFTDSNTIKVLTELQTILENKMPMILDNISKDPSSPKHITANIVPDTITGKQPSPICTEHVTSSTPLVSPKTPKQEIFPLFHDVSCNNKPIVLPPKKRMVQNVKSLDEILNELDSQQSDCFDKSKVRKLIRKFSNQDIFDNDVVLRNSGRNYTQREHINSDELSRLLEELAKVTNAPILLPGVTSSLNGANVKDEELSKLLPAKQRRFSEPDYDIPRPHKSLTILPKKEDKTSNVIGSTRFFGPILKPSGIIAQEGADTEEIPHLNSITPDSLEEDLIQSSATNAEDATEENPIYSSRFCTIVGTKSFPNRLPLAFEDTEAFNDANDKIISNFLPSDGDIIENDLYADVRFIKDINLAKERSTTLDQEDEVFIDSLEVCKNEVSTEF